MNYLPFAHLFSLTLAPSRLMFGLLAASTLAVAATLYLGRRDHDATLAAVQTARNSHYVAVAALVLLCLLVAASATGASMWLISITCAYAALTFFWLLLSPGRATLSAARVTAGALLVWWGGWALTLSDGFTDPVRAALGAAAFVIPIIALGCLFPLAGWTTDIRRQLGGRAIAPWLFAVLPVLILATSSLGMTLSVELWKLIQAWLLPMGLLSGVFYALGWASNDSDHYVRLALADFSLALAVIGTKSTNVVPIVLLVIAPHLLCGPVLITAGPREKSASTRLHWLLLSGIPPTPAFWGRLLAVGALAVATPAAFVVAVAVCGSHLVGCILASMGIAGESRGRRWSVVPWALGALALLAGVAPSQLLVRVFGS